MKKNTCAICTKKVKRMIKNIVINPKLCEIQALAVMSEILCQT